MKVNTFTNINIVNNPAPQTVEYKGKKRKKTRNLSVVIHVLVWDGLMRLIPTATTPYYSCVCSIQIVSLIGNPFLAMWFNSGHFDAQCTWSMFGCWREAIDTRVVCALILVRISDVLCVHQSVDFLMVLHIFLILCAWRRYVLNS